MGEQSGPLSAAKPGRAYVLALNWDYEGFDVHGVYSTEALAGAASDLLDIRGGAEVVIFQCVLDGSPGACAEIRPLTDKELRLRIEQAEGRAAAERVPKSERDLAALRADTLRVELGSWIRRVTRK